MRSTTILILALATCAALGQTRLTLDDAIARARTHSPVLKASVAEAEATLQASRSVSARSLPQVSANGWVPPCMIPENITTAPRRSS